MPSESIKQQIVKLSGKSKEHVDTLFSDPKTHKTEIKQLVDLVTRNSREMEGFTKRLNDDLKQKLDKLQKGDNPEETPEEEHRDEVPTKKSMKHRQLTDNKHKSEAQSEEYKAEYDKLVADYKEKYEQKLLEITSRSNQIA